MKLCTYVYETNMLLMLTSINIIIYIYNITVSTL